MSKDSSTTEPSQVNNLHKRDNSAKRKKKKKPKKKRIQGEKAKGSEDDDIKEIKVYETPQDKNPNVVAKTATIENENVFDEIEKSVIVDTSSKSVERQS